MSVTGIASPMEALGLLRSARRDVKESGFSPIIEGTRRLILFEIPLPNMKDRVRVRYPVLDAIH
jgi:hypothetical protein